MKMDSKRGSGILLHITSLPGKYGIGDLGNEAYEFVDFLRSAKQQYWQFLCLGPTNPGLDNSPYMSCSAFAGNPLLINPDALFDSGFLSRETLQAAPVFSNYLVEFEKVISFKEGIIKEASDSFRSSDAGTDFYSFCEKEAQWLDDYAIYMSLREKYSCKPWYEWPVEIATRRKEHLDNLRSSLAEQIVHHKFIQFCFFKQWNKLHSYAAQNGISLIGDLPFYVGLDSADVWANQDLFMLDKSTRKPTHVAGVPPDYFSETGQRWGNPVYRWLDAKNKPNNSLYEWWDKRLQHLLKMVDLIRIDHFRGFEASWQIPADEDTAINGNWVAGPGKSFFDHLQKAEKPLPIIAEDLGTITPPVTKLLDDLGYPGMKVLQFAFDSDETNPYLPHNYESSNYVVYTGTHDNDTTVGWFLSPNVAEESKTRASRYTNSSNNSPFNWDLIRLAFSSVARIAIIPLQDLLGFGEDCRMNTPSTCNGNWRWRVSGEHFTDDICRQIADETQFYGRTSEYTEEPITDREE